MRKIREILRLKWVAQRSHREVARSLGVSAGAVAAAVGRARARGADVGGRRGAERRRLGAPVVRPAAGGGRRRSRPEPDLAWLHQELRRPGVTLELLHVEYLAAHPTGYRYSAFCDRYRAWRARQRLSMRQVHTRRREGLRRLRRACGPTIVDAATGEVIAVELFVAVLGASNYTFAEATRTQQSADWIASHVRAVEYFGGVPAVWVPDQLRTRRHGAVPLRAGRAAHLRRVGAALSHRRHSGAAGETAGQGEGRSRRAGRRALDPGAAAPRDLLLPRRAQRAHPRAADGAQRPPDEELWRALAARALRAVRSPRAAAAAGRALRPRRLAPGPRQHRLPRRGRSPLLLGPASAGPRRRSTSASRRPRSRSFSAGTRVWLHARSYVPGRHTTVAEHMPKAHRAHLEWSPSRLLRWGATIGAATEALVQQILASRPHPEQGYRSCLGLLRLAKRYGPARLNAACDARASPSAPARIATSTRSSSTASIASRCSIDGADARPAPTHDNVRGPAYYHEGEPS